MIYFHTFVICVGLLGLYLFLRKAVKEIKQEIVVHNCYIYKLQEKIEKLEERLGGERYER